MRKRICLLAGFDPKGIVQDYVVYLARELSKISDVYYFFNGVCSKEELSKLKNFTKYAVAREQPCYDFGSWQSLIHFIGWNKLSEYEEMIICNDSVYGPMTNLEDIFDYMSLRGYDFWGLTENYTSKYHLDSYFMVFSHKIVKNQAFHSFWENINPKICRKTYQKEMTEYLTNLGFSGNSYIKNYGKEDILAHPIKLLDQKHMPFIRVKSLKDPAYHLKEPIFYIDKRIYHKTGYDAEMIKNHLASVDEFEGFGVERYIKNAYKFMCRQIDKIFPTL